MMKIYLGCLAAVLCGYTAVAQESPARSMREIKPGSVFLKPGVGGFFKLGRIDNSLAPNLEAHAKSLRNGFVWSLDGAVMISRRDYIGATFSRTNQSGSFNNTIGLPGGSMSFRIDNTETIGYTGLHYGNMMPVNHKNTVFFHTRAGLGLFSYRSTFSGNAIGNTEFKESNIGFQLGAGLEARLGNAVSWVADADLLSGNVKIEGEKENLSQIRLTTGLLFRF
ncbi:MAG: hypothetical protein MUF62_11530 [Chitinophagaceae bacterium]|nr:hypothetical protein [Chitinophagaceae bacterium]